jgi:hypothetical protein
MKNGLYGFGLDVLGAGIALGSATTPDVTTAANHAISAGSKFARKRSRGGNKLVAAGRKMITKQNAIRAQTAAAGKLTPAQSPVNAAAGKLTPPKPVVTQQQAATGLHLTVPARTQTAAIRTTAVPTRTLSALQASRIMGDLSSLQNLAIDPNIALSLDAAATVADLGNGISPLVDQVTPVNAALGAEGNAILDHCQTVIDAWNPDDIDWHLGGDVKQIQNDIASWTPRAQAAIAAGAVLPAAPGPFDPGQAGGGGGGGSDSGGGVDPFADDGGGGSQAVQDFRESGVDPFEEGGGDGGSTLSEQKAELEEEGEYDPMADAGDDMPQDSGTYSEDDYATLDSLSDENPDDVLGIDWTQIFYNPVGIAQDAMKEGKQNPRFDAHAAQSKGGKVTGPSPAVAAQLAASKARLAALQAQLHMAVTPSATTSPWQTQQPGYVAPIVQPAPVPTDDNTTSSDQETSIVGMTPDELADIVLGAVDAGYPMEEAADIVTQAYETQITDAVADPERAQGSVHRGASYLNELTYPPHGASGGQEGGSIVPKQKLYIGHESYSRGLDVLGGGVAPRGAGATKAAPRAGFVQKTAPGTGRKFTSLVVNNPKRHDHTATIKNARDAGKRAVSMAAKLTTAAKKVTQNAGSRKLTTAVHGAPVRGSGGTSHPVRNLISAAQMAKIAAGAKKAGQKAVDAGDKHAKVIAALNTKIKAGAANARTKLKMGSGGSSKTLVHGDDGFVDGDDMEHITEVMGAYVVMGAGTPDPNNPGYLTDGSPDPGYVDDSGTTGGYTDPSAIPGPPDFGVGPAPSAQSVEPQPNIDYVPDPYPNAAQGDVNQYSSDPGVPGVSLPDGAIVYDGTVQPPYMALGSYSTFYGSVPGGAPPAGGNGSGYQWHEDGWYSFRKDDYAGPAGSGDFRLKKAEDSSAATGPARSNNSMNLYNWGPMIGQPGSAFQGLRYDVAGNQWFWYYDKAPDWAKAPMRQALLNQAITDYQANVAAAAADAAAAALQDKLDAETAKQAAKQQAADDAAQQHQLDQEARQAQADAATQALADEAAARQQAAQDASYATQTAAEADAQAKLDRDAALTAAAIDQKAAETEARLAAMQPPAQDSGAYDDGSGDGSDDTGEGNAAPFDADAKAELDDEVMGAAARMRRKLRHK